MKLEQIKINGFGILHDLTIDFEPDLTVIYGLNGSGKSTLLNFFRSVLYGFYQRGSPRRYEPLLGGSHGGSIRVTDSGRRYMLNRVGDRRSGGVLIIEDLDSGATLPEGHVQILTGGISQSLFETVYAFGLSELQQLKFLQDQDLSALLYSIGLGANISLADIYEGLESTMDSIYKVRGSKPELNRVLGRLKENAASLKAMGDVNRQYQSLIGEIEAKKQEAAELRGTIEERKRELQHVKIKLEAWPHWQKLLVAREKLQHLPELDLPENALARLQAVKSELEAAEQKYHQAMARVPLGIDPESSGQIDLNQLKPGYAAAAAEFEQIKPQLDVAAERHRGYLEECAETAHEIGALEKQLEALAPGGLAPDDLMAGKQWLEELKTLYPSSKVSSGKTMPIVHLIAALGWLVTAVLFILGRNSAGVLLNTTVAALLLLWFGKDLLGRRKAAQERERRVQELTQRLGIGAIDEIAVMEGRLAKAEELLIELEQQKRDLLHSQARLAASEQNLAEKQARMEAAEKKLKELLEQYRLPDHLGINELKTFLDVAEGIRELRARQEELRQELEEIYRLCGTSDPDEIARLYQIQKERRELMQEAENLEIVLLTYLGSQDTRWEEIFGNTTKADLVQELERLEGEISRLTAGMEQLQEVLGGLSVKREMLEQSQQLEELELEREILKTRARNLAARWASLNICRWAIEQVSRKYEQERQPEVLRLAGDFFAAITDRRYRRIYAPIGMQEVKIEAADGEVLSPIQLSQGTVEQLYLALRFALAVQIAQETVEIPIFADDILVNFDRFRLANTVELMKELGSRHQIVLLTCHQRIADLFPSRHVRHLDDELAGISG